MFICGPALGRSTNSPALKGPIYEVSCRRAEPSIPIESLIGEEGLFPVRVLFPQENTGVKATGPKPENDDSVVDDLLR